MPRGVPVSDGRGHLLFHRWFISDTYPETQRGPEEGLRECLFTEPLKSDTFPRGPEALTPPWTRKGTRSVPGKWASAPAIGGAQDQVINEANADNVTCFREATREREVFGRRRGVAARVGVKQDEAGSIDLEPTLEDGARLGGRTVHPIWATSVSWAVVRALDRPPGTVGEAVALRSIKTQEGVFSGWG